VLFENRILQGRLLIAPYDSAGCTVRAPFFAEENAAHAVLATMVQLVGPGHEKASLMWRCPAEFVQLNALVDKVEKPKVNIRAKSSTFSRGQA
jgi:hypothetical protein